MGKISVYLPDELIEKVKKKTKEDDLKQSQLIQRALKEHFEAEQEEEGGEAKLEQLEDQVDTIKRTQDALLKKLNLRIKKPKEERIEEEKVVLLGEDEEEESEEEEDF